MTASVILDAADPIIASPPVLRPGWDHPLMGARLSTLLQALLASGPVAPAHLPLLLAMLLSATLRAPFRALDQLRLALAGNAVRPEAPVFIIGHWRSGTTHLHNLLACSPQFGHISPLASGLPDEILTLGTWLRPLLELALPEDRHVDRVAVGPDSPQEDEIPLANLQLLSIFHALYFPRYFQAQVDRGVFFEGCSQVEIANWCRLSQGFVAKIALHQQKPLLLIKNPVYTARIALLRQIWPAARFIHIRRNPYEVFASTRSYYRKMLPMLALQPFDHVDIEAFVLETFVRLMRRYDEDSADLPPERLCEVSYEQLCAAPMAVLERIHRQLDLADWPAVQPRVSRYLASIAGFQPELDPIDEADRRKVEAAWGPYLAYWRAMPRTTA